MSKKHHRKLDHFEDHSVDSRDLAGQGSGHKKVKAMRANKNGKQVMHGHFGENHIWPLTNEGKRGRKV